MSSQAITSVMCLMQRKGAGTVLMILVFPRRQNRKSGPVEREVDTYSSTSTSKLLTLCRTCYWIKKAKEGYSFIIHLYGKMVVHIVFINTLSLDENSVYILYIYYFCLFQGYLWRPCRAFWKAQYSHWIKMICFWTIRGYVFSTWNSILMLFIFIKVNLTIVNLFCCESPYCNFFQDSWTMPLLEFLI